MTSRQAFAAYEAVRHRLPTPPKTANAPRYVDTLEDVMEDYDVFLLDAFGVLNIGEAVIPETPERVQNLKAAGKRVLIVSNAAGVPHAALMAKYKRLGYDFATDDVITSRKTLLAGLDGKRDFHWGLMATPSAGLGDLEGLNLTYLGDDPAVYDAVDGFLLVGAAEWRAPRQALLEASLNARPRSVLVGNPDIVAPREIGFSSEPGHYAHRLADRTGVTPDFFGKPFRNIYDLAFRRLGDVDPARVLMVGDSLHTDILGARTAGISSALVSQFGFFAGEDVPAAITASGIIPDVVVKRP